AVVRPYSTCVTLPLSVAQLTVVPEEVIEDMVTTEISGGARSLATITVTPAEGAEFPAASRATALRLWVPFEANVEFQASEKGAEVSSAPRLTPSSLNCTPATARLSDAVADTVIV